MTTHTFTSDELAAHNAAIRSAALAEAVNYTRGIAAVAQLEPDARKAGVGHPLKFPETWGELADFLRQLAGHFGRCAPTPPGMVCVPREPTKAMCEAADALPAIHAVDDLPLSKAGWSPKAIQNLKRYRAMLAAAPGVKE